MKVAWAEITIAALIISAGVGVFALAHKDEGRLTESKERGATIVSALERYSEQHGEYPEQLSELVPAYLERVAPPTWGLKRWRYRGYPPDTAVTGDASGERTLFQLSVAADQSGYPVLYYDIATRRWVLNN